MQLEFHEDNRHQELTVEQIERYIIENQYDGFVDQDNNVFIVRPTCVACLNRNISFGRTGIFEVKTFCYLEPRVKLV